ncbi:MAG: ABC transporter substrate-binding protein [Clostridia bacterium]|nr:ABC transporter substrate-binding protein [Clostridia bacterium]
MKRAAIWALALLLIFTGARVTPQYSQRVPHNKADSGGEAVDSAQPSDNASPVINGRMETQTPGLPPSGEAGNKDLMPPSDIVVGVAAPLSGYFATDLWGLNNVDRDIRELLHAYSPVNGNHAAASGLSVLTSYTSEEDEEGDGRLTLTFRDDLLFSDGTPITASDYAFSLLLTHSPLLRQLGANEPGMGFIRGMHEYQSGTTHSIQGVRLLPGNTLIIHVSPEYTESFYHIALLDIVPYPISVIAPGCTVCDNGSGIFVCALPDASENAEAGMGYTPGEFTAQMLAYTLLDPQNGYVFHPKVTSGPYTLDVHDVETGRVRLVKNKYYLGNDEGMIPEIESIQIFFVPQADRVHVMRYKLADLLVRVTDPAASYDAQRWGYQSISYRRPGMTMLSFACESGVASRMALRRAIAHSVDKPALIAETFGREDIAFPVHAYYGYGPWMDKLVFPADAGNGVPELNIPQELNKLAVAHNITMAEMALIYDGWIMNADGGLYLDEDSVRHRLTENGYEPLILRCAAPENSLAADVMIDMLQRVTKEIGIGLKVTRMPFNTLLEEYTRVPDRAYDMFFLATDFMRLFGPSVDFSLEERHSGTVNVSGLKDEKLMRLGADITRAPAGDWREYMERWLRFQTYWVEVMPMVPLYSSPFFDLYQNHVSGYHVNERLGWPQAILRARVQ